MKNAINHHLTCLVMIDNNKPQPTVEVKSQQIAGTKTWRCTGYVNGKPITEVSSRDKEYNEREVRSDLAEAGYVVNAPAKVLAPKMAMKGSFAEVVNKLNPGKKKVTDTFLSENAITDLRTEYAA